GDQHLSATGTVTVAAADLSAGASFTVSLEGGTFVTAPGQVIQSKVAVLGSATLAGTGDVLGATTVATGGTVSPGTSPGILNLTGVSFAAGSLFTVEANGSTPGSGHDQLSVTGSVSLSSATTLAAFGAITSNLNPIVLIANDGTDAVTGNFAALPE